MPLNITTEGDVTVITPCRTGDSNPDRLIILVREEIRKLLADSVRKVVVDCSDIDFLSSTEVGAMIGAMREINQAQGAIVFTGIGVRLAEIFEVMRIIEVLPIRLTTREAQLELSKIRKEPNILARLTSANPTLAQINAWSDGKIKARNAPAEKTRVETPEGHGQTSKPEPTARPEDEETVFGRKPVVIPAPPQSDPWNSALQTIRQAQSLCESQGIEFKPTMSFQDFLGLLSMKMPPR